MPLSKGAREAAPRSPHGSWNHAWAPIWHVRPPCRPQKVSINLPSGIEVTRPGGRAGPCQPLPSPGSAPLPESGLPTPLPPPGPQHQPPARPVQQGPRALRYQPRPGVLQARGRARPPLRTACCLGRGLPTCPGPTAFRAHSPPPSADHSRARPRPAGVSVSGFGMPWSRLPG